MEEAYQMKDLERQEPVGELRVSDYAIQAWDFLMVPKQLLLACMALLTIVFQFASAKTDGLAQTLILCLGVLSASGGIWLYNNYRNMSVTRKLDSIADLIRQIPTAEDIGIQVMKSVPTAKEIATEISEILPKPATAKDIATELSAVLPKPATAKDIAAELSAVLPKPATAKDIATELSTVIGKEIASAMAKIKRET